MSVASQARYALLRDLDSEQLYPFGVLYERDDGGAKLLTYDQTPGALGLRQEYDDFAKALRVMSRSFLVSAIGREGEKVRDLPGAEGSQKDSVARVSGRERPEVTELGVGASAPHETHPRHRAEDSQESPS